MVSNFEVVQERVFPWGSERNFLPKGEKAGAAAHWLAGFYSSHCCGRAHLARSPQGPHNLASFRTAPGHMPRSWEEAAPLKDRRELAGWTRLGQVSMTRRGDDTGRGGRGWRSYGAGIPGDQGAPVGALESLKTIQHPAPAQDFCSHSMRAHR